MDDYNAICVQGVDGDMAVSVQTNERITSSLQMEEQSLLLNAHVTASDLLSGQRVVAVGDTFPNFSALKATIMMLYPKDILVMEKDYRYTLSYKMN